MMKKMMTKRGHEWFLPQSVGEFQNAGVNLDRLCDMAGMYLCALMSQRDSHSAETGRPFNPDINSVRSSATPDQKARARVAKMLSKMTPESRAAMLAELSRGGTQ